MIKTNDQSYKKQQSIRYKQFIKETMIYVTTFKLNTRVYHLINIIFNLDLLSVHI